MFQDSGFKTDSVGGGGYISSPVGESARGSQGTRSRKVDTITSVEIADIYKGFKSDEDFKLCDVPLAVVTIIGVVTSVEVQSTNITYKIDDMTDNAIIVRQWLNDSSEGDNTTPLMESTYARVLGVVRMVKGEIFVLAHNIYSLTDMNELTTHLLEVVHTKLVMKKRQNQAQNTTVGNSSKNFNAPAFQMTENFSPIQAKVLSAIKTAADERGCSIQYIKEISKLSVEEIKKALVMLQDEGHIYPTIDNDHYASTC